MNKERRFNLIDEAWIPVSSGRASLREIFSCPDLKAFGGTPLEKIALFKLVQAIAQAAHTPANNEEWLQSGPGGLAKACLAYLEQWHDAFWLYGPAPFLQFPAVEKAELKPYRNFMPEIASGTSTTLLFQSQKEQPLDDGQKALLLLVNMSCCLGGKKLDKKMAPLSSGITKGTPKAGPAICSQGLLHSFLVGRSLQETVWLNLLTQEQLAQERLYENGVGIPPWEVMPKGEADETAEALKRSLMGRLIPMARFCLLNEDGIHAIEGIQHPNYLEGGMVDPSVTGDRSLKKPKMIWADPQKRPWRMLPSLLSFLQHDQTSSMRCLQLFWCIPRLAGSSLDSLTLWSGGIKVSNNSGEQFLTGNDDTVESEVILPTSCLGNGEDSDWYLSFQLVMKKVENWGNELCEAVANYYKAEAEKEKSASERGKRASLEFWQLAERYFLTMVRACIQEGQEERDAVLRKLRGCVLDCYARACPQETARQLTHWAKFRPFSRNRHSGEG